MQALPPPERGGRLEDLRRFVNLPLTAGRDSERAWKLLIAWVLATFRPRGPYPILVLHGEQGSGKSFLVRIIRSLIDPNVALLRSEPRDMREIMIAANNVWVLAYDNLSYLESWFSDALCRLSTGGGLSTRELYSDSEEVIFDAQRPIVVNGIEELATRADLLDRSIILYLTTISEDNRQTEDDLWAQFDKERPHILGAILEMVSGILRHLRSVKLPRLPRLADFATWVTAAEPSLKWKQGTFLEIYEKNRCQAHELALDASVVAVVLQQAIAEGQSWKGTASELLKFLDQAAEEKTTRRQLWPKSPKALSNHLRRLAPNLRAIGMMIDFKRQGGTGDRHIIIERVCRDSSHASQPSYTDDEEAGQRSGDSPEYPSQPVTDGDGRDARVHTLSNVPEEVINLVD
jgi:hypothetical protein